MNTRIFTSIACAAMAAWVGTSARADVINFEDKVLAPNSFYNGGPVTNSNGWDSGGAHFSNNFDSSFGGFWDGFAYSNVVNTTTPGFGNQYASYPGGGHESSKYAVAFTDTATISFAKASVVQSIDLANTTYAALSMRNGDAFATKFGGADGNAPDFFRVNIFGLDQNGNVISQSSPFYLADYRFANNAQDYILNTWATVNLAGLGVVNGLGFSFESSDVGQFGINTPTYFALDNVNIQAVPEPSSMLMLGSAGLMGWQVRRWRKRRQSDSESRAGAQD